MKTKIFLLLFLCPLLLVAQKNDAVQLLERAVGGIEADAAVQMTFDYSVCDNSGEELFSDNGSLKLDGERYSLLLAPMKLWCDGETQWSYIAANNEIYVTTADSDEAQVYNPLHLMGLYKKGYDCSLEKEAGKNKITLLSTSAEASFSKVVIMLDEKNNRPCAMCVYVDGEGFTSIAVTGYKTKCMFDERAYCCPVEDFPGVEVVDMR